MSPQERSDVFKAILESGMPLTPTLNYALEHVARDKSLGGPFRLLLYLWRKSWGNWCPRAVIDNHPRLDLVTAPPGTCEFLRELILGPGPCPFCSRNNKPKDRVMHPSFKWHIYCLAKAYALDASVMGSEDERAWAREVLTAKEVKIPPLDTSDMGDVQ